MLVESCLLRVESCLLRVEARQIFEYFILLAADFITQDDDSALPKPCLRVEIVNPPASIGQLVEKDIDLQPFSSRVRHDLLRRELVDFSVPHTVLCPVTRVSGRRPNGNTKFL